ncbi:CaiB/BaiF CoA transferase family protein [Thermodesulfobacteriota bacterium]
MENQALAGLKVLDFGWALVGSMTTKYLADHGAQVIRVESVKRIDLPRANRLTSKCSANNPDDKRWFLHLNTSKMSLKINIKHPRAREVLDGLVLWADVINENFTPGTLKKLGLDYESIKKVRPDIIMVSGSAYGQTGPMAQEWGVDGTGASLSGYLDLTGWPDRGPVGPNSPYGDTLVPFFNAAAVISALDYKRRTGKGQHIDGAMLEICVHPTTPALLDYQANDHMQTRNGNRIERAAPHGVFPCKGDDRWCAIAVFTDEEWESFCHVLGDPAWTKQPEFETLQARKANEDRLEELTAEWTKQYPPEEVMEKMQAAGVGAGVVQTTEDIVEYDPQLKEREFLIPLEHPVIGVCGHPTPSFKLLGTKADVKTAPCMGEHNEYICTQILGMSDEEFVDLVRQDVFQ